MGLKHRQCDQIDPHEGHEWGYLGEEKIWWCTGFTSEDLAWHELDEKEQERKEFG